MHLKSCQWKKPRLNGITAGLVNNSDKTNVQVHHSCHPRRGRKVILDIPNVAIWGSFFHFPKEAGGFSQVTLV